MRTGLRCVAGVAAWMLTAIVPHSAFSQIATSQIAAGSKPAWLDPSLAAAAKKEGTVVVYSSTNEQEGLPLWKLFETATGIKVNYLRASDSQILARILIESRAGKHAWDVVNIGNVNKIPPQLRAQFEPSEAHNLIAAARDPDHRWYGVYANYNAPAYNTNLVKRSELPATYADFLKHPEWAGKIAIDRTDGAWLSAIFQQFGPQKGRKLITDIVAKLKPVIVDGHLALARDVGSGEYAIALNNYVMLTLNVKFSGSPTDFWTMDPVALFFGQVGVAADAPHPNAARLAANFLLSREAQAYETKFGRVPTRPDVPPNPPDVLKRITRHKVISVLFDTAQDRKWNQLFGELFHAR